MTKRLLILVASLFLSTVAFAAADPCASEQYVKQHAFANITTATTTQLIAPPALQVGNNVIFVCQVTVQLTSTTTANTVLFEQGTGAACSSPTVLTATYTNPAGNSALVTLGGAAANFFKTTTPGTGLCAVTTVGSTPTIAVDVSYFIQ